MRDSIKKLRDLRDDLCKKQQTWQEAFAIRDRVVSDLIETYQICMTKGTRKKQIEKKILSMFEYLDIDLSELEEKNVSG